MRIGKVMSYGRRGIFHEKQINSVVKISHTFQMRIYSPRQLSRIRIKLEAKGLIKSRLVLKKGFCNHITFTPLGSEVFRLINGCNPVELYSILRLLRANKPINKTSKTLKKFIKFQKCPIKRFLYDLNILTNSKIYLRSTYDGNIPIADLLPWYVFTRFSKIDTSRFEQITYPHSSLLPLSKPCLSEAASKNDAVQHKSYCDKRSVSFVGQGSPDCAHPVLFMADHENDESMYMCNITHKDVINCDRLRPTFEKLSSNGQQEALNQFRKEAQQKVIYNWVGYMDVIVTRIYKSENEYSNMIDEQRQKAREAEHQVKTNYERLNSNYVQCSEKRNNILEEFRKQRALMGVAGKYYQN